MPVKDRNAARKEEGSFADKSKGGQQVNPSTISMNDVLRDRVQKRKQKSNKDYVEGSELKGSSFEKPAPESTTSSSSDPAPRNVNAAQATHEGARQEASNMGGGGGLAHSTPSTSLLR